MWYCKYADQWKNWKVHLITTKISFIRANKLLRHGINWFVFIRHPLLWHDIQLQRCQSLHCYNFTTLNHFFWAITTNTCGKHNGKINICLKRVSQLQKELHQSVIRIGSSLNWWCEGYLLFKDLGTTKR